MKTILEIFYPTEDTHMTTEVTSQNATTGLWTTMRFETQAEARRMFGLFLNSLLTGEINEVQMTTSQGEILLRATRT